MSETPHCFNSLPSQRKQTTIHSPGSLGKEKISQKWVFRKAGPIGFYHSPKLPISFILWNKHLCFVI